jgi:hypothetical protein
MSSTERLALQGAINIKERKIQTLKCRVKGAAALIRDALATYRLMHPEQIDAEQLQANYEIFAASLGELRQLEAELKELKAEV